MYKNYFKTALRNLLRQRGTTMLNIGGLTLGLATSLILFLLVRYHKSFDTYHSNYARIYRASVQSDGNDGKNYTPGVYPVFPEVFSADFPEAEEVTFISYRAGSFIVIPQAGNEPKKYDEESGVAFAQPNFFKVFDRKILIGDGEKGLDEPNEVIVSRRSALKYFGKEDAIGEVLQYDDKEFRVTAIMEDYPNNTDFPFDVLASYITVKKEKDDNGWSGIWSDDNCYFTLKEGKTITGIEARMPAFVTKYLGDSARNRDNTTFVLQRLSEIHFDDRFGNYNYNTVSESTLLTLSIIGIFLLLTACINFVNLTTAEAVKRSKEVGIRKSLGSSRPQLIYQFLGETSLVTLLSIIIAVVLAEVGLSFLNPFLDLTLTLNFSSDIFLWLFLISTLVIVSLLSGFYPALVVSGFNPVNALKNQIKTSQTSGFNLRRSLVVLQFVISQLLIIATVVLISQMKYLRNKELGFRKDAIITIPIPVDEQPQFNGGVSKMRTLRDEMLTIPGVEQASLSNSAPSSGSVSSTNFSIEGDDNTYGTQVKQIDGNYIELYDIKLVAGKGVSDLDTAHTFVVNERFAQVAGFANPEDIIGKNIRMWRKNLPVSGVVKNFHTVSLQDPLEATIMLNRLTGYRTLSVRVNPQSMQNVLKEVQTKWERTYPEYIYSYRFLDEQIREFYESEQRMSVMLTIFTSLAIFIGCLGLFGLTVFMANQKTKEIGVRKVLGASVESILMLFSKEFIKLILIGFLIATPLAWYATNQYLDQFAYKITLGPVEFLIGLTITFLIAIVTVAYRSMKAAVANPTQSLRSE
ncbi:MAG TPA: ABC transporter permease [Cyclobacteriaceae bacterium]|nr:ABC transporter permease [Cyclobacteriaceae bacterium]